MPTDPAEIARELRTQDNLATSHPLFIVEQRDRVYGIDSAYGDSFEWIDSEDNVTADAETAADLDAEYRRTLREPDGWKRVGYIDRWRFVTACLTRKGCEDYITANGHNLESPRIYVASAHRNREWQALRKLLMTPADPLAEALESERLREEINWLRTGIEPIRREAYSGLAGREDAREFRDDDAVEVSLGALRRVLVTMARPPLTPTDPSPLRRLLAALARLESTASGDGEAFNAALDAVIEAGREVRGVLGGEVER